MVAFPQSTTATATLGSCPRDKQEKGRRRGFSCFSLSPVPLLMGSQRDSEQAAWIVVSITDSHRHAGLVPKRQTRERRRENSPFSLLLSVLLLAGSQRDSEQAAWIVVSITGSHCHAGLAPRDKQEKGEGRILGVRAAYASARARASDSWVHVSRGSAADRANIHIRRRS